MQYLDSFTLPSASAEEDYFLNYPPELEMLCYSHESIYPFKIFPQKRLSRIEFEPITIFYGGNGSGKSTLLNVIAEKLGLLRSSPFREANLFANPILRSDCSALVRNTESIPRWNRRATLITM